MEEDGLIQLKKNGRSVDVTMSKEGEGIFCKSMVGWRNAQSQVKLKLKKDGVDAIGVLFSSLTDS
ncbi:hypothetical protein LEP1GSC058_1609 [Leptospira fainei serovar Hurstbridge str. BUT 6]|uniref:Uncharacterized protein n=1 Tax=Leptospira fainei serovar Hurstbridge str. BUT 6 TaxID=1193011 RepID=S3UX61_9LEPT|nr:hypothetical protein [Leptospira fainei]EPG74971.1 hypothetical protein LEP1GSC058_1609 [Leptospira fainei serovar Hurstbridge str. BUT 6]